MFIKGFHIELEDALSYPSAALICSCIENYAKSSKENLNFISKQKPVTFYLDDISYVAEISMARGGYYIRCKEYK